ncbi:MAG: AMP-binding protein [Planctomycetes bacterium]|nr:AMP-binding protein [Planctomycetota bacterium]
MDALKEKPILTPQGVFFFCGIGSIPVLIYIVVLIPQTTLRFLVWLGSNTIYKIRIVGRKRLPPRGGGLLVSNYISWLDAAMFLLASSRTVRIIAWSDDFHNPLMRRIARFWGVILVGGEERSVRLALRKARRALRNGHLVVIVPKRGFSRSDQMPTFRSGMLDLLKDTGVPLIPVYLDELGVGIFSIEGGKFLWQHPRLWRHSISIHFGEPIDTPEDAYRIRRTILDLGASAVDQRIHRMTLPIRAFVRRCKQRKRKTKVADSITGETSGGQLLARTLVARRLLLRHVLDADEKYVGILLPPSLGAVVTNMAVSLDRRITVNLNYSASSDVLNECIAQSGIRHVLTSRKFMEKMDFDLDAEIVYLEDLREKVTKRDKIAAAWNAFVVPYWRLERKLKLHKIDHDDVLTIIFTSGSTGMPKGVMLTHANIASNVEAVESVVHLTKEDVIIGILPFFHSFGYTITLWTPLSLNVKGAYHFSPLDPQQVGKLCQQHNGTVLLATPTFLRTYLRRCTKEQFESLDIVIAGAEKLPSDLCVAFEEKFGVRPVEGYGCTELSPLVSVNIPPSRSKAEGDLDLKEGTVGRTVPGQSAKVTDLDTGEELGVNEPGMLWITGPNVMKGYLGRDDLTAEVIQDGWYRTGDVALIDNEGFIKITGRESRFSKIGGEMVPHIQIEDLLNRIIGIDEEEGIKAAVTAIPDPKKGERLVVVHTKIDQLPADLRKALADESLPNIFIPSENSFIEIDELPMLGSGKLDLKQLKQIAEQRLG